MNRFMNEKWPWVEGTHALRDQVLAVLSDAELAFTPGGTNKTLGELFREMGEVEHSYLDSFKAFKQTWDYHNAEAGLAASKDKLGAWFKGLDADLKATAEAFSDADLSKTIERSFPVSIELQFDIYIQALLIFLGKASIFLRAMNKPLPEQIQSWIW